MCVLTLTKPNRLPLFPPPKRNPFQGGSTASQVDLGDEDKALVFQVGGTGP
jgi:hypothetical protein